jgi:hypothetical protein
LSRQSGIAIRGPRDGPRLATGSGCGNVIVLDIGAVSMRD